MPSSPETRLDVYAAPYIPLALKQVNEAPSTPVFCKPVPFASTTAYIRSFAGASLLPAAEAPQNSRPTSTIIPIVAELTEATYVWYFQSAVAQEATALELECARHALYQVPLSQTKYDEEYAVYRLVVPGLRETSLPIEVGDIVSLKQLRFDPGGNIIPFSGFISPQGKILKTGRLSMPMSAILYI